VGDRLLRRKGVIGTQQTTMPASWADPAVALRGLATLSREASVVVIADEAERLAERASAGRYYVASLGQFKRGKSTLLNALLGTTVLPTGVTPVTSVATILRFGARRQVRVRLGDEDWREIPPESLADYVSEEHNPRNRKGVRGAEVFEPSPLLAGGMCLVDTPGIGSVFLENSEATRAFVPQVDAALVVLGGDPPISGEELALIRDVARHVDQFLFLLNKADRLAPTELAKARRFTAEVVARALEGEPAQILQVSATERASGGTGPGDWPRLEEWLRELSRTSGPKLASGAARRGFERLGQQFLAILDERRLALVRPIAESDARMVSLSAVVGTAEQSLSILGVSFLAEQERLRRALEDQRQGFLARALPVARSSLEQRLQGLRGRARKARQEALEAAERIARTWIETWVQEEVPEAEGLYQRASGRLVDMAGAFLSQAARQPGLARLGNDLDFDLGFRVPSQRRFTYLMQLTGEWPLSWILDGLLPARWRIASIRRQSLRYLRRLMEANSSRVQFDLDERMRESGRKLENELRARLGDVLSTSTLALESARRTKNAGETAVRAELERTDAFHRQAQALNTDFLAENNR